MAWVGEPRNSGRRNEGDRCVWCAHSAIAWRKPMLRRFLKIGVASMLIVASTPLTASAHSSEFEADLDPGQETQTPAVVSDGEGEAESPLKRTKTRFHVEWDDLTSGAGAGHIHCAPAGSPGPIGVTLLS